MSSTDDTVPSFARHTLSSALTSYVPDRYISFLTARDGWISISSWVRRSARFRGEMVSSVGSASRGSGMEAAGGGGEPTMPPWPPGSRGALRGPGDPAVLAGSGGAPGAEIGGG